MESVAPLHPNDLVEFAQYPDPVQRQTYPPLPRKGLNPNAVASDGVISGVMGRLPVAVVQQIAQEVSKPVVVPSTPETDPYVAAGWL